MPEITRDVVCALLTNARGEVLLQLRDDKPGLRYANMWTLFGGSVEEGEQQADAIRRELIEELALSPRLTYWKRFTCGARTIPGEVITYNHAWMARLDETPTVLNEGQAMAWFSRESAAGLELAFAQQNILEEFFASHLNLIDTEASR
ncbi:MAG: NUDIX domain-containing protein [Pleurocapsa minor GSE-CHR-MK-17-07R]|jgi:8-oxo-dGTP diphosphatase|nr:NUDIX domain-containing protein [Pleurocapsa minor GSE-CHR-MK 17-07R]